jgi:hypothetical protein
MDKLTLSKNYNLRELRVTLEDLYHSGSTQSVNPRQECYQTQSDPAESGNQTENISQLGPSAPTGNTRQRHKWSNEEYKEIVYCYYHCLSFPTEKATTHAVFDLWKSRNQELAETRHNITPNSLANIRRDIIKNRRLLPDVIAGIEQSVNGVKTSPTPDDTSTTLAAPSTTVPSDDTTQPDDNMAITDLADEITTKWEEVRYTSFEQRQLCPNCMITEK